MYVGSSITLSPYHDREGVSEAGFSFSSVEDNYTVTDPYIFSVELGYTSIDTYGFNKARSFTLTALKVGSCTFTATLEYEAKNYVPVSGFVTSYRYERIKYYITVIEAPKVISITIPNSLSLNVGENYTFSPVIAEPGANTTLSWSSTNPGVATVFNGTVQAVGAGTTSIICTADNGVSAQCLVTVNAFVDPLPAVKDTTVNLTVTVGIPFVITPIHELNIAGGDASTPTPYVLSDPSACTVASTDCPGWNGGIYRIYTITPEKAGVFVFKETCSCTIGYAAAPSGAYTKTATATYIVNVVEPQPTVLGDMDGDGKVTINDVRKVFDIYLEEIAK